MKVAFSHSEAITNDIRSFYFKPITQVNYVAGQFIELYLHSNDPSPRQSKHWFTLSSSPTEPLLAITTKLPNPLSSFKKTLTSLQSGTIVTMIEPMGDFVLPINADIPLVFVAGGIGITPVRSMVKYLLDSQEHRQVSVYYAVRDTRELIFIDLLTNYGVTLNTHVGQPVTAQEILAFAPLNDQNLYYISGPEPFTEVVSKDLHTASIPPQQIISDFFNGYVSI